MGRRQRREVAEPTQGHAHTLGRFVRKGAAVTERGAAFLTNNTERKVCIGEKWIFILTCVIHKFDLKW